MNTSTASRPVSQRKPREFRQLPDVEAGGVLWTGPDRLGELFAGVAILTVTKGDPSDCDVQQYWAKAIHDGGRVLGVELRKFGTGQTYQVLMDGGVFLCDCADATFRNRSCKHCVALWAALCRPAPDRKSERDEATGGDACLAGCGRPATDEGFCAACAPPF